jgi:general secretion pathway protein D
MKKLMNYQNLSWRRLASGLLGLVVGAALQLQAQPGPGGFGGGFGGGGAGAQNRARTSRTYPNSGTVGDAVISIDPESRNLVVIADDETSLYISQVISNLDRPQPQVLIKVVFLEVTHNNSLDIGLEGAWGKGIGNSTTGAVANAFGMSAINSAIGSNAPLANMFGQPIQSFSPMPPGAGLYQIFAQDYQVTLRAIAQAGKAKVLSRPSIVARNNQPATITVGQQVPLITSVRFDTFGNAINSVTYQPVGIILSVTPFITGDGMVEMIVSPQTSQLVADRSQWVSISAGVSAPLINSRSADTVVVTPDRQTVIIGGLMEDDKAESESKIPFLGDIPYLGNLFKRKTKSDSKTELLIFLTPHIIRAPSEMAQLTAVERQNSEGTKALTEKELHRFLEGLPTKEATPKADNEGGNFEPPR